MPDIRSELVSDDEGLDALRTDWSRIHGRSRSATPFNTWAWMRTWWRIYRRPGWTLHIIRLIVDDKPVGLIPLYRRQSLHGHTLRFLGTGEPERDEVVTEYCDILVDAAVESAIVRRDWTRLAMDGWSGICTTNILNDSLVAQMTADIVTQTDCGVRFRMNMPASWEEFLAGCSSNMRRQIRLAEREAATADVSETVFRDWRSGGAEAFEALARLHQSRWQSKGAPGAFSSGAFRQFHEEIVSHHAAETGSEIRVIQSGGDIVAALYNFRLNNTVYFYQSGVLPLAQFRSPGVFSHCTAIRNAIDDNISFYDLMRGDEYSYKNRFPCQITGMCNVSFYKSSLRTRLFVQAQSFLQGLRQSIMSKRKE